MDIYCGEYIAQMDGGENKNHQVHNVTIIAVTCHMTSTCCILHMQTDRDDDSSSRDSVEMLTSGLPCSLLLDTDRDKQR